MKSNVVRPPTARWAVGLAVFAAAALMFLGSGPTRAGVSARRVDPAQVVPLDKIHPGAREVVAQIIRDHTLHCQGAPETFPCDPRLYLCLLNEPSVTLALWKDLSPSPVQLQPVGADRYQGSDGKGTSATWEFVYRSPKLHVLLANLDYTTPRGNARLDARIVLVVHSGFFREVNGEPWIQHDVEAFVKIDSRGWKAVARTVRPVIERVLDDQVREAGWFVSLMGRLVESYPTWACQVTTNQAAIAAETRQRFRAVVLQARKPGASDGRPALAENASPEPDTRTR